VKAHELSQIIDDIEADVDVEGMPLADLVALGAALEHVHKRAKVVTELLRQRLRAEALAQNGGAPGTVELHGKDGSSAHVQIPGARWVLRNGYALESLGVLEREIGPAAMQRLFSCNIEPHPAIEALAEEIDEAVRDRVLPLLDQRDATPRIRFEPPPKD